MVLFSKPNFVRLIPDMYHDFAGEVPEWPAQAKFPTGHHKELDVGSLVQERFIRSYRPLVCGCFFDGTPWCIRQCYKTELDAHHWRSAKS